jgi:hypothetical protein
MEWVQKYITEVSVPWTELYRGGRESALITANCECSTRSGAFKSVPLFYPLLGYHVEILTFTDSSVVTPEK